MSRMKNKILLVGSIPGANARDAMRLCGEGIGRYLDCLPDGETGKRRIWINHLAATVYQDNPGLMTINRPLPVDLKNSEEWRQPGEDWAPRGYEDHWQFTQSPGPDDIYFENLGYAAAAKDSYADFCDLRDDGVIGADTRFMVAIPLAESAVRPFVGKLEDYEPLHLAYDHALQREIMDLTTCIPANDLVLQFDICFEVIAQELRRQSLEIFPFELPGEPQQRFLESIVKAASGVPPRVLLGLHLCYGDLGHRHIIEPPDLGIVTSMAEAARAAINRSIDYFHMPVPRDRRDDEYFKPLDSFDAEDSKLYLGLLHLSGGLETSIALLETASRHAQNFGIATECGFGRRAQESIPDLLEIHRAIAERISV